MGTKIPSHVKTFSKLEMREKKLTVQHSSVLRILTKWAGNLEDIFKKPEKHIMMRLEPFKDIHNKICNLSIKDK